MPKYYLLDENKNLVEGYDKEGFLALLEEAIEQGSLENIDENSAVASKLRSVLNGTTHHIEFVTQAQYNDLEQQGELVPNTYYFITDDTTLEGFENRLNELLSLITNNEESINRIINGTQIVGKSTEVTEKMKGKNIPEYPALDTNDILGNGFSFKVRSASDNLFWGKHYEMAEVGIREGSELQFLAKACEFRGYATDVYQTRITGITTFTADIVTFPSGFRTATLNSVVLYKVNKTTGVKTVVRENIIACSIFKYGSTTQCNYVYMNTSDYTSSGYAIATGSVSVTSDNEYLELGLERYSSTRYWLITKYKETDGYIN